MAELRVVAFGLHRRHLLRQRSVLDMITQLTKEATVKTADLEMPYTYYGVALSDIGEDGDLVALGHIEPRRAVAAFNRLAREDWGFPNLADDRSATLADVLRGIEHTWAIRINECGRCDRDPECGWCLEIREAVWALECGHAANDPGAFPVTMWRP